jgi:hypothetical protein
VLLVLVVAVVKTKVLVALELDMVVVAGVAEILELQLLVAVLVKQVSCSLNGKDIK